MAKPRQVIAAIASLLWMGSASMAAFVAPVAVSGAQQNPSKDTTTLYVTGMDYVDEVLPDSMDTVTVTVPVDSNDTERVAAVEGAVQRHRTKLKEQGTKGAGASPQKSQKVYGSCGWSYINFADTSGTRRAYVKVQWGTNAGGTAYRANVHIWDTAWNDFSTWDFPDTGNLNGSRFYSDDFTMLVDEAGAYYGAKLSRGDVYIPSANKWCKTRGPSVDNVRIW